MTAPAITLVLLPGMDGSGELFADFIQALGDAVVPLVVAYPPDQVLDYAGLTEFARCCLPQDQPFVLLGESFSGPVAIALAASHPPGLAGLVLCCTFARNPVPIFSGFKHVLGALPVTASLTSLIAPFLLRSNAAPTLRRALRTVLMRIPAALIRARLRSVLEVDHSALMRTVTVPVLYLQAAQDRVVTGGAARHLATLVPTMQLISLAGPHLLLQTLPAESARAVQHFVASACANISYRLLNKKNARFPLD